MTGQDTPGGPGSADGNGYPGRPPGSAAGSPDVIRTDLRQNIGGPT
jgi:hypothetical protein